MDFDAKAHVMADRLAHKLSTIDKGDDIAEFGPRILELMRGCPFSVWQILDEQPGRYNYMNDRFYMLRRVRNDQEWGRKMFDGFTKE